MIKLIRTNTASIKSNEKIWYLDKNKGVDGQGTVSTLQ